MSVSWTAMRGWIVCLAGVSLIWVVAGAFHAMSSITPAVEAAAEDEAESSPRPVLVELFTSEGCSNCPTADRFLVQLHRTQPVPGVKIIALGEHVDYWNRRGWADPFSSSALSARQHDYAGAFGNDGVYTPQMIVDGQQEFVGSDHARAFEAIRNSARAPKAIVHIGRDAASDKSNAQSVTLHVRAEGLERTGNREGADVWLAITEDDLESNVVRGGNAGRRLQHVAVVRQMQIIGKVEPVPAGTYSSDPMVTLRSEWNGGKLNAVVFIQERRTKRILGAAALPL